MENITDWCALIWENRQYIKEIENVNQYLDLSYGIIIGSVVTGLAITSYAIYKIFQLKNHKK